MSLDLFAGMRVSDFAAAKAWYERLLGSEPAFMPHATEAVWELGEHRFLYILAAGEPGGGLSTIFAEDFDSYVAAIAARGIEPAAREAYSNGVRKATYRDPDGNELGVGGPPA